MNIFVKKRHIHSADFYIYCFPFPALQHSLRRTRLQWPLENWTSGSTEVFCLHPPSSLLYHHVGGTALTFKSHQWARGTFSGFKARLSAVINGGTFSTKIKKKKKKWEEEKKPLTFHTRACTSVMDEDKRLISEATFAFVFFFLTPCSAAEAETAGKTLLIEEVIPIYGPCSVTAWGVVSISIHVWNGKIWKWIFFLLWGGCKTMYADDPNLTRKRWRTKREKHLLRFILVPPRSDSPTRPREWRAVKDSSQQIHPSFPIYGAAQRHTRIIPQGEARIALVATIKGMKINNVFIFPTYFFTF